MQLTRIFWPNSIQAGDGDLLGWRVGEDWVCVLCVAPAEQDYPSGSDLQIVGTCHRGEPETSPLKRKEGLSVTIDPLGFPVWNNMGADIIQYTSPNPHRLRYLTLDPINFAQHQVSVQDKALSGRLEDFEVLEDLFDGKSYPVNDQLDVTIDLINTTYDLRRVVGRRTVAKPAAVREREEVVRSGLFLRLVQGVSKISGALALALWYPLVPLDGVDVRIMGISATAKQFHTRLSQIRDAPTMWQNTRRKGQDLQARSVAYINFYNMLWLVANDVIVGVTLGAIIRDQIEPLSRLMESCSREHLVDTVKAGLFWLDDWPVGLKLNTPLSRLLCDTFSGLTDTWLDLFDHLSPAIPSALYLLSCLSFLGATFTLSFTLDVFNLCTAHLRLSHVASQVLYRWEKAVVYALWNLFRGKRWNTLRERVDSYDYELDQLFLGTLLFIISIFLYPTILTYYLFFSMIRFLMLMCHGSCETILAFMNSFPLFAVMLRVKEPSRLPGGIKFVERTGKTGDGGETTVLDIQNQPISYGAVFAKFAASWVLLSAYYSPIRILVCIVKGSL